jgi:hypothetical protein
MSKFVRTTVVKSPNSPFEVEYHSKLNQKGNCNLVIGSSGTNITRTVDTVDDTQVEKWFYNKYGSSQYVSNKQLIILH